MTLLIKDLYGNIIIIITVFRLRTLDFLISNDYIRKNALQSVFRDNIFHFLTLNSSR